jgi:hypothetical protein
MIMNTRNRIAVPNVGAWLVVSLFLTACGGGGGGGSSGDQAFGGLWDGSWDVDGGQGGDTALGITTDNGQFQLLLLDATTQEASIQISGTAVVDGTQVSGTGLAYTLQEGDTFPGGTTVTGFSFMGTLSQRNTLTGSWMIDAGQTGEFNFAYDADYERDSSLTLLNGSWLPFDFVGNQSGPAFNILDGDVFRQTPVCTSSGTITVPNPNVNVYAWNTTITTTDAIPCPLAGNYSGLATVGDTDEPGSEPNDAQVVLLTNPDRALSLLLLREP